MRLRALLVAGSSLGIMLAATGVANADWVNSKGCTANGDLNDEAQQNASIKGTADPYHFYSMTDHVTNNYGTSSHVTTWWYNVNGGLKAYWASASTYATSYQMSIDPQMGVVGHGDYVVTTTYFQGGSCTDTILLHN